ncbi:MAG: cobalamin biosynthesis protein CobD [Candidatus Rokubacteria bacterium]|nr:cobalamin biosynthesis protein CobD [Candidatus Rokubacteria bacterium]
MSVLLLALLLDVLVGDPPNRWHPVAWTGRLIAWGRRVAPRASPFRLTAYGGGFLCGTLAAVVATVAAASWAVRLCGWPGLLLDAALLKCTFSLRGLLTAARGVRELLAAENLPGARERVGRDLVSRPTAVLDSEQVASATVESVAENLTDSVVAPILFFLLLGVPGAWAYRLVNTVDSMWGYREGELEYLGKPAARLDDLLNWIPSRLAGFGIVLGALLAGESAANAWRTMWREHGRTASPNAGWTMAAMAGALGVALEKPGAYRLGSGASPTVETIDRAIRVMVSAGALAVAAFLVIAAWLT